MKPQEATRLEYGRGHAVYEATETASDKPERVSVLNKAVTWSVLGICLAGWSIIGLFLWVPDSWERCCSSRSCWGIVASIQ